MVTRYVCLKSRIVIFDLILSGFYLKLVFNRCGEDCILGFEGLLSDEDDGCSK
jgi:hypothetical protein